MSKHQTNQTFDVFLNQSLVSKIFSNCWTEQQSCFKSPFPPTATTPPPPTPAAIAHTHSILGELKHFTSKDTGWDGCLSRILSVQHTRACANVHTAVCPFLSLKPCNIACRIFIPQTEIEPPNLESLTPDCHSPMCPFLHRCVVQGTRSHLDVLI